MESDMICVVVGECSDSETFPVPADRLCRASKFFSIAVNNHFKESRTKLVNLPDDEPLIFRELLSWLFGRTDEMFRDLDSDESIDPYLPRVMLWVLADKLIMPELQNAAMATIQLFLHSYANPPWSCTTLWGYGNSLPGSPLRRMLARTCVSVAWSSPRTVLMNHIWRLWPRTG